jgi:hypothetical protein
MGCSGDLERQGVALALIERVALSGDRFTQGSFRRRVDWLGFAVDCANQAG